MGAIVSERGIKSSDYGPVNPREALGGQKETPHRAGFGSWLNKRSGRKVDSLGLIARNKDQCPFARFIDPFFCGKPCQKVVWIQPF